MYSNVGRKLKKMATGIIIRWTVMGAVIGFVTGLTVGSIYDTPTLILICFAGVGLLGFWIGHEKAALLYAYGEIAEGVMMLRHKVCGDIPPVNGYPIPIPVPQPYQQMAWRCVHCGWQSTTDDKFCRSCGKPRT